MYIAVIVYNILRFIIYKKKRNYLVPGSPKPALSLKKKLKLNQILKFFFFEKKLQN